jgi:hypothetical protein
MDVIRSGLLAMHPRAWRQRYGEEFRALLEDTALTPTAVADILKNCSLLQARAHSRALLVVGAVLASVAGEITALRTGLTANILWAPTNVARALALFGTVGPGVAVIVSIAVRHRAAHRGEPQ